MSSNSNSQDVILQDIKLKSLIICCFYLPKLGGNFVLKELSRIMVSYVGRLRSIGRKASYAGQSRSNLTSVLITQSNTTLENNGVTQWIVIGNTCIANETCEVLCSYSILIWYKQWKGQRWWEVRCESLHGPFRGKCSTSHHLRSFHCLKFFIKPVARLRFGDFCRRRFGDFCPELILISN